MKNNSKKDKIIGGTPWNSIKESITNSITETKDFKSALKSPCHSCSTSPCCSYLPLKTFHVNTLMDLDHARYLLNFDNIELGISSAGHWSVYYTYPCRFLDTNSFNCTIHNLPEQPNICKNYNPYSCWYKKTCTNAHSSYHIRIDRTRLKKILDLIQLDDQGNIIEVPEWNELNILLKDIYDENIVAFSDKKQPEDKAYLQWLSKTETNNFNQENKKVSNLENPCNKCSAPCCTTLIFPQNIPDHYDKLDYFKFCLGFPGIELGISDGQWSLIVKTKCNHLDQNNKCSVYGSEERPIICKYYDEWSCSYKHEFLNPRPKGFMRLKYDEFIKLMEILYADNHGALKSIPNTEEIRIQLETLS